MRAKTAWNCWKRRSCASIAHGRRQRWTPPDISPLAPNRYPNVFPDLNVHRGRRQPPSLRTFQVPPTPHLIRQSRKRSRLMDFTVPIELISSVTGVAERLYRNREHIASKTSKKLGPGATAGELGIFGGLHNPEVSHLRCPFQPLPLKSYPCRSKCLIFLLPQPGSQSGTPFNHRAACVTPPRCRTAPFSRNQPPARPAWPPAGASVYGWTTAYCLVSVIVCQ